MERAAFRQAVFTRDGWTCVACGDPAVDAHHIMERRLWEDGGYHLDNGASLCADCHMEAERGTLTPEYLSALCGIKTLMLPLYLERDAEYAYDKWANVEDIEKGVWYPGPLFYDESVQKVLAWRIERGHFQTYVKYPRTPHLPWSPGATSDDVKLSELPFEEGCEIVIMEKLDGERNEEFAAAQQDAEIYATDACPTPPPRTRASMSPRPSTATMEATEMRYRISYKSGYVRDPVDWHGLLDTIRVLRDKGLLYKVREVIEAKRIAS